MKEFKDPAGEHFEFLSGVFIGVLLVIGMIAFMSFLSGCTTTKPAITKQDLKDGIEIYKDMKEEIKQTEQPKIIEQPKPEEEPVKTYPSDYYMVRNLNWSKVGDPHGIMQCYFGNIFGNEVFQKVSELPIDFTCTLNRGGVSITKPESDETGRMASYPGDHMQGRRAFVCVFDNNGILLKCEDFAESYELDNRWKEKPVVNGLVIHCKQGQAVSRTALTEVGE